MISLSVVIMAHPKRRAQVEKLLEELRAEVPVVWDEKGDRWDTGRRAMLAYDPTCTHHLVLQDDILACRDLIGGVKAALEEMPGDVPLCLYMAHRHNRGHFTVKAGERADSVGASFVTMKTLNWGPGIVVPTNIIREMIDYCDPITEVANYDKRLSRYWELKAKKRVYYTWPSLVDHADGPSLVPGRLGANREDPRHSRVAQHFLGEERSALALDWTGPVIHVRGSFKTEQEEPPPSLSLSVAVMAHPRRAALVERLLEDLGRPATVVWDRHGDRWDTGRRAVLAASPGCSHHLVLQDDVIVCRDLVPGIIEALKHVPEDVPVSLYLGRHKRIPQATQEAERRGASFIAWEKLDHGLGIVLPTFSIPEMLAYTRTRPDVANYDARLSTYFEAAGIPTYYTCPSLVDHAQEPSLVEGRDGMRTQPRVARAFVGRASSALGLDWTGPVVRVSQPAPEPVTYQRNIDAVRAREKRLREEAEREPPPPPLRPPKEEKPKKRKAVSLSAVIMAHPKRRERVEATLVKLDRKIPVVWDECNDRWDTGRRAMLAHDPECTHHLVLQDDLLIPRDLLAGIERALTFIPPDAPLVGYIGKVRPDRDKVLELVGQANARKASFVTMSKIHWGPLIVVPTSAIPAMIELCDGLTGITNYDLRLSRYWEEMGCRAYYTWPSLVDHDDGPSLVHGRTGVDRRKSNPSRIAHRFCGEEVSVLDLDWSGPVLRGA